VCVILILIGVSHGIYLMPYVSIVEIELYKWHRSTKKKKWVNNQWAIFQLTALFPETGGWNLYFEFMQQLQVWMVRHFLFWASSPLMLDHACRLHNEYLRLLELLYLEHDTCSTVCSVLDETWEWRYLCYDYQLIFNLGLFFFLDGRKLRFWQKNAV